MKIKSLKSKFIIALGAVFGTALIASVCAAGKPVAAFADGGSADYNQSYRNTLAFSAREGWNNDPNGLLYANGVYHMYYQYNWDKTANGGLDATENVWGHMSWGHATSADLVHWSEQPVALPENTVGKDGKNYGMMFSGSAVYDENNTSGLFDTDPSTGKVAEGQGIVATLTQPDDSAGGQRQILAYSKDNGQSFEVHGEILGAADDGGIGDGEFRDPKIFRSERHGKWLMAVGGGAVRMYSSDNLIQWTYLGQTGYWGECPDISRFTVGDKEKYVLIISPEDKPQSHAYNKTTRAEAYYPAEYYAVGDLNESGLFVSNDKIKRLSEGIDSYAFQSFNNPPDGKVYGVSWAASWKTVGEYEKFRKTHNGGMTAVCELTLEETDDGYRLSRLPVTAYDSLRGGIISEYSGSLQAGRNAFGGVAVREADIVAELDFNNSGATYAELNLRVSAAEKITVKYDVQTEILSVDRSQSSLLAAQTPLYKGVYSKKTPLNAGKLSLKILLDRAFISVFANGGRASFFSAVFPSAVSNGISLVSDGDIGVNARIYAVQGIFGNVQPRDELIISTDKIDTYTGAKQMLAATSFADGFTMEEVTLTVPEGAENIEIERLDDVFCLTPVKKGFARLRAEYKGQSREVEVYIYENGFVGGVDYDRRLGGFSYISDDGLHFESVGGDAFLFGDKYGADINYSASFTPLTDQSQACGLVFGISDNLYDYFVATADFKDNCVKLWRAGVGDLRVVSCPLSGAADMRVAVTGTTVRIYINGKAVLICEAEGYAGGYVGLNVYNSKMRVNGVTFGGGNQISIGDHNIIKVVNVTDGSRRLFADEYSYADGVLCFNADYLSTLEADTEYTFRVVTATADFDVTVRTDFKQAEITSLKDGYTRGDKLTLAVSDGAEVSRLEINGEAVEFTLENGVITVSAEHIRNLVSGEHTIKAYTTKGRPSLTISISGPQDYREEEIEIISHTFFYIDIAIFGAAIAAYVAFTVAKKLAKRKKK